MLSSVAPFDHALEAELDKLAADLDGLPSVFTPNSLLAYQEQADAAIQSLNRDIGGQQSCFNARELDEWRRFFARWGEFYPSSYWERMFASAAHRTDGFLEDLEDWQARFAERCRQQPSNPAQPYDPPPGVQDVSEAVSGVSSAIKWVAIAGVAGAGLWFLWPVLARVRR